MRKKLGLFALAVLFVAGFQNCGKPKEGDSDVSSKACDAIGYLVAGPVRAIIDRTNAYNVGFTGEIIWSVRKNNETPQVIPKEKYSTIDLTFHEPAVFTVFAQQKDDLDGCGRKSASLTVTVMSISSDDDRL